MSRNRARSLPALICLLTLAGVLVGPAASAQRTSRTESSPPSKDRVFAGEARVTAVEVPVNVIQRNGEPVRGLTAEDFEIVDEGESRDITSFEVVDLEMIDGSAVRAERSMPASARRHILLLFDISFSSPTSILKARQAARDFALLHLHPTDLVGVATYSLEYGPRLVLTFTSDRSQVAHAVDSLGLHSRVEVDPLRFIIVPRNNAGADSSAQTSDPNLPDLTTGTRGALLEMLEIMTEQLDKNERSYQRSQITAFTRSLGEMARILSTIPSRKHVVLFSEGFDSRLITGDPLGPVAGGDPRSLRIEQGDAWRIESDDLYGNTGLQRRLGEMVKEFRRADCVIQSVDIGGLRAEGAVDAAGPNSRGSLNSGQEGLFYMANETGGELFKDANDLEKQLGEMLRRNSVTYVLTFQPERLRADGSYHRLRVRLRRDLEGDLRGARVSHRQGYYAPRPYDQLHPLEKDLLAANAITTGGRPGELDVDVLVAPFRANEQWAYVPVIVEIDGASLLAEQKGKELQVEIYAYATDREGEMQGFFTQRVKVDLGNLRRGRHVLETRGLKYYGHLELASGDYQVRVLVRNAQTGRSSVELVNLQVPAYAAQNAVVLPPFFLEEPGEWLMLRERPDEQSGDSTIYPFTVNGEPYVPAARPKLSAGENADLCLVAYNLGSEAVVLNGEVKTSGGELVAGGTLRLMERTTTGIEGYHKLLARFEPNGLTSGDYTLHVMLTDPSTGNSQSNSILFSVAH